MEGVFANIFIDLVTLNDSMLFRLKEYCDLPSFWSKFERVGNEVEEYLHVPPLVTVVAVKKVKLFLVFDNGKHFDALHVSCWLNDLKCLKDRVWQTEEFFLELEYVLVHLAHV